VGNAFGGDVVAGGDVVNEAQAQGLGRAHVAAAEHQVQRGLCADQAGCALRATGARQQAQLHFGQAQLGVCRGDARVGRQGHLQATAQRRAVDGGHDRLVAGLDGVADLGQPRVFRGLAELADVGAGDEGPAFAHDDDGVHGRVGLSQAQALHQALAHGPAQGVDRRVGDREHGDVLGHGEANGQGVGGVGHVGAARWGGQGGRPGGATRDCSAPAAV